MSLEDPKDKEYSPLDTDEFALSAADPTNQPNDWEKITSHMPAVYSEGLDNLLENNNDEPTSFEDHFDF
ncbi:hypothetical protein KC678_01875 [Candidatus Dojkabacteria bacterium]|uniref:Uncharacterized protein n=1 Tax=Candidatus Dojkabacteria bacterium TaxID=2099670 RepID=A0A955L0G0_9BACT|nr:hypothetical protein [Candidatus Dojkabacteria bacterium]